MPEVVTSQPLPPGATWPVVDKVFLVTLLWVHLAVCWSLAPPLAAQPWTGSISGAWITQDSSGSDASSRTQLGLDEGFLLEALELGWKSGDGSGREFRFEAWGFGDAEPSQGADLDWRAGKDWRVELEYRRTESLFALIDEDLGNRTDDWAITRLRGGLIWEGWKPVRLSLGLSQVERTGVVTQPFRELGEIYLLGTDLDETRRQASLRVETRTLPVHLTFEQSFARLERRNTWFSADDRNVVGTDPDLLLDADNQRREDRDIPTSRLVATYGKGRVEATGAVLWSAADLDVSGETSTTFGLAEDTVGRVQFAKDLLGSASLDALVGRVDVGVRLADRWTLRFQGRHHDRAQDAALLGRRILRLTNALGDSVEIPQALDESTFLDVVDTSAQLEIEHQRKTWSAWAGVFDARREVDHLPGQDQEGQDRDVFSVRRDTDGFVLGVAWHLGRRFKASVEAERGSFERFVFRTDPETVRRLTAKLRANLARGWGLRLRGRFEEADNPIQQSARDRQSDAYGFSLFWADDGGGRDVSVDFDQVDATTETVLLLPGGATDLSVYDLSLRTIGVHGRVDFGKVHCTGGFQWLEDSGETWPLEAWNARLRLAYRFSQAFDLALFGQLWSYEEELAGANDFDLDRFGLALTWRFE